MNYNISFSEMNKLAEQANSKKSKLTLEDMPKQVTLQIRWFLGAILLMPELNFRSINSCKMRFGPYKPTISQRGVYLTYVNANVQILLQTII